MGHAGCCAQGAQLPAPTPQLPSFSAASCAAAQLTANGQFVSVNSINLIPHALSKIKPSINPAPSDLPCLLHNVGISSSSPRHASMWSQGWGGAHQAASVPGVHGQGFSILLAQEQGHPEVEGEPWPAGGRGEQCLGPGVGQGGEKGGESGVWDALCP